MIDRGEKASKASLESIHYFTLVLSQETSGMKIFKEVRTGEKRFQEFMACFVGEKFYSLWLGLRIRNSTIYDFFTGERNRAQESRRKSKGHCFQNFLFFFTILFRSSATTRRKQSREADFYNPSCREEETERLQCLLALSLTQYISSKFRERLHFNS